MAIDMNGDSLVVGGGNRIYVFERSGTTWAQRAELSGSNTDALDGFGSTLAISNDTIVVGAPYEQSAATGVNGNGADNSLPYAGAAYVFVRNGTSWTQQAYLKPLAIASKDQFGWSVSIDRDTVAVGADFAGFQAGAAYVFERTGTTWAQKAALIASNDQASASFGRSVAVAGDLLLVGASFESSNAVGVDGNQNNTSAQASGAAYLFQRGPDNWSQVGYAKATDTATGAWFGRTVAATYDMLEVGAWLGGPGKVGAVYEIR
jgi:hypothetical protein